MLERVVMSPPPLSVLVGEERVREKQKRERVVNKVIKKDLIFVVLAYMLLMMDKHRERIESIGVCDIIFSDERASAIKK